MIPSGFLEVVICSVFARADLWRELHWRVGRGAWVSSWSILIRITTQRYAELNVGHNCVSSRIGDSIITISQAFLVPEWPSYYLSKNNQSGEWRLGSWLLEEKLLFCNDWFLIWRNHTLKEFWGFTVDFVARWFLSHLPVTLLKASWAMVWIGLNTFCVSV